MPRHNRRFVKSFLKGPGSSLEQPAMFERPMQERCALVVRLREVVEGLLGDRLRQMASDQGGYSYDPVGLFSVMLFGYMQGMRSSRKLEESCKFDCRYEYLSGGLEPDHATIARFRRRSESELEELFLLVCQEAQKQGIIERRAMVVDGTKVAAARSQWQRAIREADEADFWEEEAKTMVSGNRWLIGYNLQVAADAKQGFIVGYVATNQENDSSAMPKVLEKVQEQSGGLAEKAVMDKGYDTSQNIDAMVEKGVRPYIPKSNVKTLPFKLNEEGQVVCPAGHVASKLDKKEAKNEGRKTQRTPRVLYRVRKCRHCEMKQACGIKGVHRDFTMEAGASVEARLRANSDCLSEEGQKLQRLRGPTIERIFGQFKGNQGFQRLLLRGLSGASIELGLLAIGYNLRHLM